MPIVYSCSGCSSAAQMANYLALQLDRKKIAQMSCIAGVGGNVRSLVQLAKSAEFIICIDGCPLKCGQACLSKHGIQPHIPIILSDFDVEKRLHADFCFEQADDLLNKFECEFKKILDSEPTASE